MEHQQASSQKPHLELPNPTGPVVATVQVKVPFGSSGLVIGKGGETIRSLQIQSKAHIELCRMMQPNEDNKEELFNVRGNPQQIHMATQLIQQICGILSFQSDGHMMGGGTPGGPLGMYTQPGGYPKPGQAPAACVPGGWVGYPNNLLQLQLRKSQKPGVKTTARQMQV